MKDLVLPSSDGKALYFIPEDKIIQAAPGDNGTTLLAFVEVVEVNLDIEHLQAQVSKKQKDRIIWHTESPRKPKGR